jgi:hypothetical protein
VGHVCLGYPMQQYSAHVWADFDIHLGCGHNGYEIATHGSDLSNREHSFTKASGFHDIQVSLVCPDTAAE